MTRGLDFTTLHVPFVAGLNQKAEWRANQPPALDVALDVQFDDIGGVQLRKPMTALGSAQSSVRKMVAYGDELLMFDNERLYSWSPTTSAWVSAGTHLAAATEETTRFAGRSDQVNCDRAELSNTVLISWTETVDSAGAGTDVSYVAAFDKITGAVIMTPTTLGSAIRIRLVSLSTKILLFTIGAAGSALAVYAIDPASPATALAGASTSVMAGVANYYYDVEKIPGADSAILVARRSVTTSYEIKKITAALSITSATKARTCDGPIAVACTSDGVTAQVVRANGTAIQGDAITISSLADGTTDEAIGTATGTPVNQIAAAYPSSSHTCYVFWDAEESTSASTQRVDGFQTAYNTVDTTGAVGTAATFVAGLGVASRAFAVGTSVFVHLTFEGTSPVGDLGCELQNTYYLYRHDRLLTAKVAAAVAGGYSEATGFLPGVQSLGSNKYAWCATERRRIAEFGFGVSEFAARAPREAIIEFDANRARRCAVLGKTLYVTGAELKQFDGVSLVELGWHEFLWYLSAGQGSAASGLDDGTYSYSGSYRWDNAKGERDRSALVVTASDTIFGGPHDAEIFNVPPARPTHKTGVAVELWRTLKDPPDGASLYLITSPDPTDSTTPNQYLTNPATTDPTFVVGATPFRDQESDATIEAQESVPAIGDVLENISPPGCTVIAASDSRLFIAGIPNDPNRVWYSKQRVDGEVAGFNDALTFEIPQPGGDITAIAFLNETLVVFRETACYSIPGDGLDNTGGGQNYGPPRLISADIGAVSAEAVAVTPSGLIFKSRKGWYLLNGAQGLQYVGAGVADYDSEDPVSVVVVESQHQIRCLTSSRMLVLDYLVQQWAEWSISGGVDACMWRGTYALTTSTQPKTQATDYTGVTYGLDIETAWIKPADLLGDCKVRYVRILGEYRGDANLRVRIARDYKISVTGDPGTPYWHTDEYHQVPSSGSGAIVGTPVSIRAFPAEQNCTAIKIRMTTDNGGGVGQPSTTAALRLTGLAIDWASRGRVNSRIPPEGGGGSPSI